MTAQINPTRETSLNPLAGRRTPASDAVALIHLALTDDRSLRDAASEFYRQTRLGRRAVAVVSGPVEALASHCDLLGLATVTADPQAPALVHEPVVLIAGSVAQRDLTSLKAHRPVRVAIAGCGVVGGGLYLRLRQDPRFEIVGVLVRTAARLRAPQPDPGIVTTTLNDVLATRPDVLLDCLSDGEAGLTLTRQALSVGVSVISANKQAIGPTLSDLSDLAQANGATFAYSAAVGGGAPVIETLLRARQHGPIARVEGVLNGTVNFLLNQLSGGAAFTTALSEARRRGFAEEDPTADLSGLDAATKVTILSALAWDRRTPLATVETLSAQTALPAGPIRQLARADAMSGEVVFQSVEGDTLFADLPDEWNALRVICEDGTVFTCRGRGAGRWPTAESVWADLLDLIEARPA
jgi:homoserine dehydrogenase